MPTRAKAQIERSLRKKGFVERQKDHHFFTYFTIGGQKTGVFTKTSHTPKTKDISDGLLKMMANQCALSMEDFCRLIDCPLSREEYEKKLKAKHLT